MSKSTTQTYAAVGYLWSTLRQIADGATGAKAPAEFALWHMGKAAQEMPLAVEGLPRPRTWSGDAEEE